MSPVWPRPLPKSAPADLLYIARRHRARYDQPDDDQDRAGARPFGANVGDRIVTVPGRRHCPIGGARSSRARATSPSPIRPMRTKARAVFVEASRRAHRWLDELARRSPAKHRIALHPRGQDGTLDPHDAFARIHLPCPGGSRDGGSASARVLHQAPDRPADALVRAMARDRTAGARLRPNSADRIPASFRAQRILLVVIGRR